jgi:SPP1 gp7 family putative phage head morphogenesis protein
MSSLLDSQARIRKALLDREEFASNRMVKAYLPVIKTLTKHADELQAIAAAIRAGGGSVSQDMLYRQGRLAERLVQIEAEVRRFATTASINIAKEAEAGATLAAESAQRLITGSLGAIPDDKKPSVSFLRFDPKVTEEVIARYGLNSPFDKAMSKYPQATVHLFQSALVQAVVEGKSPEVVARDFRRTLQIPLNAARTAVRTALIGSYRDASLEHYRSNSHVVKYWRWSASKSKRTCPLCLAMDGREFPLEDSFGSHPACRCSPIPVTASWEELGIKGVITQPSRYKTGRQWLDEQSPEVQTLVLGKKAASLYQKGELTLSDFVGYREDQTWGPTRYARSLKEIMEKPQNPLAFPVTSEFKVQPIFPEQGIIPPKPKAEKPAKPALSTIRFWPPKTGSKVSSARKLFIVDAPAFKAKPQLVKEVDECSALLDELFKFSSKSPKITVHYGSHSGNTLGEFAQGYYEHPDKNTTEPLKGFRKITMFQNSYSGKFPSHKPQKTFLHEFGHYLDYTYGVPDSKFAVRAASVSDDLSDPTARYVGQKAMAKLVKIMQEDQKVQKIQKLVASGQATDYDKYYANPKELLARAFEDYTWSKGKEKGYFSGLHAEYRYSDPDHRERVFKQMDVWFKEIGILK